MAIPSFFKCNPPPETTDVYAPSPTILAPLSLAKAMAYFNSERACSFGKADNCSAVLGIAMNSPCAFEPHFDVISTPDITKGFAISLNLSVNCANSYSLKS